MQHTSFSDKDTRCNHQVHHHTAGRTASRTHQQQHNSNTQTVPAWPATGPSQICTPSIWEEALRLKKMATVVPSASGACRGGFTRITSAFSVSLLGSEGRGGEKGCEPYECDLPNTTQPTPQHTHAHHHHLLLLHHHHAATHAGAVVGYTRTYILCNTRSRLHRNSKS